MMFFEHKFTLTPVVVLAEKCLGTMLRVGNRVGVQVVPPPTTVGERAPLKGLLLLKSLC